MWLASPLSAPGCDSRVALTGFFLKQHSQPRVRGSPRFPAMANQQSQWRQTPENAEFVRRATHGGHAMAILRRQESTRRRGDLGLFPRSPAASKARRTADQSDAASRASVTGPSLHAAPRALIAPASSRPGPLPSTGRSPASPAFSPTAATPPPGLCTLLHHAHPFHPLNTHGIGDWDVQGGFGAVVVRPRRVSNDPFPSPPSQASPSTYAEALPGVVVVDVEQTIGEWHG